MLANRLKQILPNIISDTQSVFQFDKAISDNILVAFKFLHHMKTKKASKSGFMALKLNMSKTYDRVEWVFLSKLWIRWAFIRDGYNLLQNVSVLFLSQFWSMKKQKVILNHLGALDKGTHCRLIFFSLFLRV